MMKMGLQCLSLALGLLLTTVAMAEPDDNRGVSQTATEAASEPASADMANQSDRDDQFQSASNPEHGSDQRLDDAVSGNDRAEPKQLPQQQNDPAPTLSEDWGEWEQQEVAIQDTPNQPQDQEFGVGIQGEDELLLNRLDQSVIIRVSGALLSPPDP